MLIRQETDADLDAIDRVHNKAFAPSGLPDQTGDCVEVGLVRALRADAGWVRPLALVAEGEDGQIVGHIVCTVGRVDRTPAVGLGPVGVLPQHQRSGVGSGLMHSVLAAADALAYPVVVLLGHTSYYPRFGFVPARSLGITPTNPAWGDAFQARPLSAWSPSISGTFHYAAPFDSL